MVDPRRNASNSLKKEPKGLRALHAPHLPKPCSGVRRLASIGPFQPKHSFRPYPSGFRLIIDPGPVSHGIFAFNRVLAGPRPISEVIPHRFRFIDIVTESPLYEDQSPAAS